MTLSSLIQELPESWTINDLKETRINLMREGVVTLIGLKRLTSEALFVSSEGGGVLRETAKVEFAGQERYWWIARKVNGVIRRVLLSELNIQNCSVDEPCAQCEVCSLMGALNTNSNLSYFSRIKLQDLISIQPFVYDEKFRVRLPDNSGTNPTPFQEIVVPPGTEFPFIVRIVKPSRRDLALFLYGNQIADGLGYGNYSKMRGDANTQWILFARGFLHVSIYDLLMTTEEIEKQIEKIAQNPVGLEKEKILIGDDLKSNIRELIESVK